MHRALRRIAALTAVVLLITGAFICALLTVAGILIIATDGEIVSDRGVSAVDWAETTLFGVAALGLLFGGWKMTAYCWSRPNDQRAA